MRKEWIAAIGLALALGCGGNAYRINGVGPAVGADAELEVEATSAGNRTLQLRVAHLPPPERLGAGFDTYHVWVAPLGGTPVLLGRLEYDEDSRRGHLDAVTPYDQFRLIVTPEPGAPTAYPSGAIVLDQFVDS